MEAKDFLSDMAQEIFGCLPLKREVICGDIEAQRDWENAHEDKVAYMDGHNSCRSTFLENIKKLK
jgi:hypothetical protein